MKLFLVCIIIIVVVVSTTSFVHANHVSSHTLAIPTTSQGGEDTIYNLRLKIRHADSLLILAIAERMNAVKEIGDYKKKHHIAVYQPKIQEKVMNTAIKNGEAQHLDRAFIVRLYNLLFTESIRIQKNEK